MFPLRGSLHLFRLLLLASHCALNKSLQQAGRGDEKAVRIAKILQQLWMTFQYARACLKVCISYSAAIAATSGW